MTRVVIVGEMYNADLQVGGGPIYPSGPGPRPPGPVDPGYSPPWARPPVDLGWGVTPPVDPSWGVTPPQRPVDPGWGVTPGPRPGGIWGGGPHVTPPIYIPGQNPVTDPVDPTKAHAVLYVPLAAGGYERITFTIDVPPPAEPPTEATPKG